MIPRADIDVVIDVDGAHVGGVDAETVLTGMACIHEYDPGVYGAATWSGAADLVERESHSIAEIGATAHDAKEFYDLAFDAEGELALTLELGVGGAVEALCAAGCPTFASCRGEEPGFAGRGADAPTPWILFATDAARVPPLEEAAAASGCGLGPDDDGLLRIWAPSLIEMIAFARALLAMRAVFDACPQMFDRADTVVDDAEW